MGKICNQLLSIPYLNKTLLEMSGNTDLIEEWRDVVLSVVNEISYKLNWVKSMHLKFWEKNAFALQQEWKAIELKWFLPKFFAKRSYLKKLRLYNTSLQAVQNTKPVRKAKCLSKE